MFDAETFSRTASLFANKRDVFRPDAVEALASDIMHRLALSKPLAHDFDLREIDDQIIAAFCDALIRPTADAALHFVERLRADGVTRQDVYLGYIVRAARALGDGWDEDRLSLLDVTYGTGHLYALMRALRAEGPAREPVDERRSALFATIPGEDHGIGITVAADLFRDVGWEIDLRIGLDHDPLVAHVERTEPSIVGLSLSTEHRIAALVRLMVAVRIIMPEAIIGVAPAATIAEDRLRKLVDIDLVFHDAPTAIRDLDHLIRLRG